MTPTAAEGIVEEAVEPVEVELATARVTIVAASPPEPDTGDDLGTSLFDLPATEPVILPVVIDTALGPVALRFGTRPRAVTEGPRRTSLADTVTLATGELATQGLPEGVEAPAVRAWVAAGREPADMAMAASFPWSANPQGMTLRYVRNGGRGGQVLMSTETTLSHQEAVEAAFHAFISSNPGLVDALEKGLALADARILRFWGDRLVQVATRQADILRQGAEVIEELVAPIEEPSPGRAP